MATMLGLLILLGALLGVLVGYGLAGTGRRWELRQADRREQVLLQRIAADEARERDLIHRFDEALARFDARQGELTNQLMHSTGRPWGPPPPPVTVEEREAAEDAGLMDPTVMVDGGLDRNGHAYTDLGLS